MATTSIRWAAVLRVVDLMRALPGLAGVGISSSWPGDELQPEHIWVGRVAGEISVPTCQAGRAQRDDMFDIPLAFHVGNQATEEATNTRINELMGIVESRVADNSELAGLDGVIEATCSLFEWDEADTREGALGAGGLMVHVHARLT